jgi:hypothetical protein
MHHVFLALFFMAAPPMAPDPDDHETLGRLLADQGLIGRIHGAVHDPGLYVFTYRKPGDFFVHAEFPLVPADDAVALALKALKRHDAVLIKGSFIRNRAPQKHIEAVSVALLEAYPAATAPRPALTDDLAPLLAGREAVGKVHAVAGDGRVLVFEHRGAVVPVYVRDADLTVDLYRNDKIRIRYRVERHPGRPAHLLIDPKKKGAIKVLGRIKDAHSHEVIREGILVRFPKSPQLKFDVYALQTTDDDGVSVEYTLVNFTNKDMFLAIQKKMTDAWNADVINAIDGRNKLVNPKIGLKARGTLNVQDPNQANPQIMLASPDDVAVTRQ